MKTVLIDGKRYLVLEDLGFQASASGRVCIVENQEAASKRSAAVKRYGSWRMWTTRDMLRPRGEVVGMNNTKR